MTRFALALVVMFGLPCVALAQVPREVGQVELRHMVATGQSLSLSRVMDVVTGSAAGEPLDVRLFESSGLFYRVVVMDSSGKLVRLVLDAQTGQLLSDTSPIAKRVRAAATHTKGTAAGTSKSKSKNGQGNSGTAGNGGNSGGNGNAGGNGKGNGNGKN